MRSVVLAKVAVVVGAVAFGVPGVWAFFWPRSFYENVATFEPFNLHFLHDLGAFQLGIAAALLAALVWRDAISVVLFGAAVGAVLHFCSHVLDADLGGRPSDLWLLGGLAVFLTVALAARVAAGATSAERAGRG